MTYSSITIVRRLKTAFFIICLCTVANVVAEVPPFWSTYDYAHTSFDNVSSPNAQQGQSLALIDGTALQFSEEYLRSYLGFAPSGYLYQTISAKKYRGKHLHVSAFGRKLPPDFNALEHWFTEQYTQWLEGEIDTRVQKFPLPDQTRVSTKIRSSLVSDIEDAVADFSRRVRDSHTTASHGVWVLLHFDGTENGKPLIQKYEPTSSGRHNDTRLWNRFNVEVSVPEECNAITIVFWSHGISKTQVDHFAVVEHGAALPDDRGGSHWGWRYNEFIQHLSKAEPVNASGFQNLSFE